MNEFLSFFLIVSIFALNASCMNPPIFGPPPPANVEFGECFFVPRITSKALPSAAYNYRHICRQKFPDNGPQPPQHEKNWYFVGRYKYSVLPLPDHPQFNYIPIKESFIKFVFLKETTMEFVLRLTDVRFQITFQSPQQYRAFYEIIYHDVNMSEVAPNKIVAVHEVTRNQDQEIIKIGNSVETVQEKINYNWYITFKNDRGEPLLIFCQTEAAIMSPHVSPNDKPQILWRVNATHYILTFSSWADAEQFSGIIRGYVKILRYGRIPLDVLRRFNDNQIAIDSQDV